MISIPKKIYPFVINDNGWKLELPIMRENERKEYQKVFDDFVKEYDELMKYKKEAEKRGEIIFY